MSNLPSVWAITVARNESDMIGHMLRHHMSLGLTGMIVFNNLSDDGTGDIAKSVPGVIVVDDNTASHDQGRKNRDMTIMAMECGAEWILAIDADELWYPTMSRTIPELLAESAFESFRVPGHNQTCTGFDDPQDDDPVSRMHWRFASDTGKFCPAPRIAYRCKPGRFAMGANERTNDNAVSPMQRDILVRHYPVRSAEQFAKKVSTAPFRQSHHLEKWHAHLHRNPDGFTRLFEKKCMMNRAKMRKYPGRWIDDPLRPGRWQPAKHDYESYTNPRRQSMALGGWAIEAEVIEWIHMHVPFGSTILELGSGAGTEVLSEHYEMFSIEHDPQWIGQYNSTYIHAPLVGGRGKAHRNGGWYDTAVLARKMPHEYDMILIDGPPARIAGLGVGPGRAAFLDNFNMFRHDVPILLDDTNRPVERVLRDSLASILQCEWEEFGDSIKRFSVIVPSISAG